MEAAEVVSAFGDDATDAAKEADGGTTLYRAVGERGLADIEAVGRYRVPDGETERKYFFETPEQCSDFARMVGEQPYTTTSVRVSPAELSRGQAINPAREGPGYFFSTPNLPFRSSHHLQRLGGAFDASNRVAGRWTPAVIAVAELHQGSGLKERAVLVFNGSAVAGERTWPRSAAPLVGRREKNAPGCLRTRRRRPGRCLASLQNESIRKDGWIRFLRVKR